MRVMKFGGTSLSSSRRLKTVADLVTEASIRDRVIVVVSAVDGVTDQLSELVSTARKPDRSFVERLARRHLILFQSSGGTGIEFQTKLELVVRELLELWEAAFVSGGWKPASKDRALGIGERTSSLLVAALLDGKGCSARAVRGTSVIRTDSNFGAAQVDLEGTGHLARWTLGRIPSHIVPVVAGFTGSDETGRPTTLGRGSSDLTATLIAAGLDAEGVEIWTDVDGVYDRDPRTDPQAALLPQLGYGEARDLARNGATVLHSQTLDPIEPLAIPLRVRNTFRPDGSGTLVGKANDPVGSPAGARRINLILAGATGGVGRELLKQLKAISPALEHEKVEVRVAGAFSTRAQLWNPGGLPVAEVSGAMVQGSPTDWNEVTARLTASPPGNPVFVDCTASPEVSNQYVRFLKAGIPVVTPNKLAWSGSLFEYQSIRAAAKESELPFLYETTVGAALPILKTVRGLRQSGDRIRNISAVLSGTLSFVFGMLSKGATFSEAVREARERGFTEPHPREDLSGADVARKLLILLREAGFELEPDAIPVESLIPRALAQEDDPEEFLDGLRAFDKTWAERIQNADGRSLAYVARFEGGVAQVGVTELQDTHPLFGLRPTENRVVLFSDRYPAIPLSIAGPGAGREVTASGVVADLLSAIRERYGPRRVA